MADNYLEKQMEDYRAGKFAAKVHGKTATFTRRQGQLTTNYPQLRVFITGGASGIGEGCVKAFRMIDAKVAFCDIDRKRGTDVAQKHGARFYPLDAADSEKLTDALLNAVSTWGDIDVLINNVGIGDFKPLEDTTDNDWQRVIDTNLRTAFTCSRFLARYRKENGHTGGTIINISSTRAFQSEPDTTAYSASKGGIAALTHSLMASMTKFGITVNCIAPGWINTKDEPLTDADKAQHPSGRVGTASDVARLAVFLAHPDNNFINGAIIPIDGGMTRKMIYC